jgi:glutamine amidotransferase
MVIIANYGVGNLASVCNMLRKAGVEARVSESPADILLADRVILPGIGHFDHGMKMLNASGLREQLDEFALVRKRPVLGICLGAQILGRGSEEGEAAGLGWLDMECQRFPAHPDLRVPHMGWSQVEMLKVSPLFKYAEVDARYYFVHSYYMQCADVADVVGVSAHGTTFTSAVQRGNVFGVQFHPEKSLRHGLAVMRAFAEFTPDE